MNNFIESLVGRLTHSVKDSLRRGAIALVLFVVGLALLLGALGFAIGGIYTAIAQPLGPIAASFIVAGILIVTALILFFAISQVTGSKRPKEPDPPAEDAASDAAALAVSFVAGVIDNILSRRRR